MRIRMLAAFAACCVGSVSSAAQEPDASEHTFRTVRVAMAIPQPCVSVRGFHARIILSTNMLVELSHSPAAQQQTEEQRLAYIAGRRAATLLALASHDQDASGCVTVDLEHAGRARDAVYLVGSLIESGDATVIRDGSTKAEASVTVHDYNGMTSGSLSFEFADGGVFLSYPTWIT